MYKPLFQKTDECPDCGKRLKITQKYCPCGKPNLDYKPKIWTGVKPIGGIEENKPEESAGPFDVLA